MTTIDRRYSVAEGIAIKAPCRVATTANITLAGLQTIDGIACVEHDRVLVKSQSSGADNGIYEVSTGNWSRTKDFDGAYDVVKGTRIYVTSGSISAGREYTLTTADPITIGTTSLSFSGSSLSSGAPSHVYPTYADLHASLPAAGDTAIMLGYSSPADGGGGEFYFDNTSSTTADGGLVEQPSTVVSVGRYLRLVNSPFVKPEWWGAKGDGSTDDSVAIQNAFDNGNGRVDLTPGRTYMVSMQTDVTCLLIPSNLILDGNGAIIKRKPEAWVQNPGGIGSLVVGHTLLANGSSGSPISDIEVRNLVVNGNGQNMTGVPGPYYAPDGVTIINATNFQEQSEHGGIVFNFVQRGKMINNQVFFCPGDGISCGASREILMTGNRVSFCGKAGIYASNAINANYGFEIVIAGNECHDNNYDIFGQGVYWSGALGSAYGGIHCMHDNARIADNSVSGGGFGILAGVTGGTGTAFDVGERTTITGNVIKDISQYGLYVQGYAGSTVNSKRISITGNDIQGAALANVVFENSHHVVFTGNNVLESGAIGIDVTTGSGEVVIAGNNISRNATSGIRFSGCIGGNVSSNVFAENGAYGIDWAGTTTTNTDIVVGENTYRSNGSGNVSNAELSSGSSNRVHRTFTFTTDIGSITNTSFGTATYTCEGVRKGSAIRVGLSTIDSGGNGRWFLSAHALDNNAVTVIFWNQTGGTVDLASGTITINVVG